MNIQNIKELWPEHYTGSNKVYDDIAEAQSHWVNLALHQPVDVERKSSNGTEELLTDEDFFEDFIKPVDSRKITLLEGAAGVGKSHLIVWTHAKLEQYNRQHGERFIIIRIPRAKGIRFILHQIQNECTVNDTPLHSHLPQDIQDHLSKTLDNFTNTVDRSDTISFTDWLMSIVTSMTTLINAELNSYTGDTKSYGKDFQEWAKDQSYWKMSSGFDHAQLSEDLKATTRLVDSQNIVRKYFIGDDLDKALPTLITTHFEVSQKSKGISTELTNSEVLKFCKQTLMKKKEKTLLKYNSKDKIKRITPLLNYFLGKAREGQTEKLLEIPLGELFREIRQSIKNTFPEKELILLHEDLKTAQGTSDLPKELKDLLDVAIFTEDNDSLCVLRTMMAYTPGETSWKTFDTTKSRAGDVVWEIKPKQNPYHFHELLARFFNTARFGKAFIQKHYATSEERIPGYSEHHPDLLTADEKVFLDQVFGNLNGYSLFPLNQRSVDTIMENSEKDGGIVNTRKLLQTVVTILHCRQEFLEGHFPPANNSIVPTSKNPTDAEQKLLQKLTGFDRQSQLVQSWGILPQKALSIFGLSVPPNWPAEVPNSFSEIPRPSITATPPVTAIEPTSPPIVVVEEKKSSLWTKENLEVFEAIKQWSNKQSIANAIARNLRDNICGAIKHFYHWDIPSLPTDQSFKSQTVLLDFLRRRIFIPNAPSQQKKFAIYIMTQNEYDSDNSGPRLKAKALLEATARLMMKDFKPTYPKFLKDYGLVYNWILSIESELDEFFSVERHAYPNSLPSNHIEVSVYTMLTLQHMCGNTQSHTSAEDRLLSIFSPLAPSEELLRQFGDTLENMYSLSSSWLLLTTACYQNPLNGKMPSILHVHVLLECCRTWEFGFSPINFTSPASDLQNGAKRGQTLEAIGNQSSVLDKKISMTTSIWQTELNHLLSDLEKCYGQSTHFCTAQEQDDLYIRLQSIYTEQTDHRIFEEFYTNKKNQHVFVEESGSVPHPQTKDFMSLLTHRTENWKKLSDYLQSGRVIQKYLERSNRPAQLEEGETLDISKFSGIISEIDALIQTSIKSSR